MAINVSAWSIRKPVPSLALLVVLMLLGIVPFQSLPIPKEEDEPGVGRAGHPVMRPSEASSARRWSGVAVQVGFSDTRPRGANGLT